MRRFLLFSAILFALTVSAQRQDFQTWWTASLEGEIFNKLDFEISPQVRLFQNSSSLKSAIMDFELSYPLTKFFRVGGKYRFQNKYYYNELNYLANRFSAYGQLNYKIKRFRLRYRGMYQVEYVGLNTREYGDIPFHEHRHKFSVSYFKKKWDIRPVLATEFFFVRKPEFILSEKKYRLTAGASYKINKSFDVGLYYRFQHEFFANNPWDVHVISTKIGFSL